MKTTGSGAQTGRKRKSAENRVSIEENTGFISASAPCLKAENGMAEGSAEPTPAAWMTPELVEQTHTVWSKEYGRPLERCEVLEILRNVRWFGEILRRWMVERRTT